MKLLLAAYPIIVPMHTGGGNLPHHVALAALIVINILCLPFVVYSVYRAIKTSDCLEWLDSFSVIRPIAIVIFLLFNGMALFIVLVDFVSNYTK